MFSFNNERYARNNTGDMFGGLTEMVDPIVSESESSDDGDDGSGPEKMDEGDDNEELAQIELAREQFAFPIPEPMVEYSQNGRDMRFYLAPGIDTSSMPEFDPGPFKALSSVAQLTAGQKRTMCGHTAMPMPVHFSPIIALFVSRIPKGATMPWSSKNLNWMLSGFHLREFMLAVRHKTLPFHSSVTEEFIDACATEFHSQMGLYELHQEARIHKLFDEIAIDSSRSRECLEQFVNYLEDYSLYYLHSIERFLFKTLVEPYKTGLELKHVLTPHLLPSLHECNDMRVTRQYVIDFFAITVPATRQYEKSHAEDNAYVEPRPSLDLQQLPHRIVVHPYTNQVKYNCPPNTVYRGYIDTLTLYEYFVFCDTENKLPADWDYNPNTWVF